MLVKTDFNLSESLHLIFDFFWHFLLICVRLHVQRSSVVIKWNENEKENVLGSFKMTPSMTDKWLTMRNKVPQHLPISYQQHWTSNRKQQPTADDNRWQCRKQQQWQLGTTIKATVAEKCRIVSAHTLTHLAWNALIRSAILVWVNDENQPNKTERIRWDKRIIVLVFTCSEAHARQPMHAYDLNSIANRFAIETPHRFQIEQMILFRIRALNGTN